MVVDEKISEHPAAGVSLTRVVNVRFSTVTVYRPGLQPELFHRRMELSGEPHMPGFRVTAAELFEDLD